MGEAASAVKGHLQSRRQFDKGVDWAQNEGSRVGLVPVEAGTSGKDIGAAPGALYDHRPTKLAMKRSFESRQWKFGENFAEYYNDKINLGNRVEVPEEELVEHLIEGIPEAMCFKIKHESRLLRRKNHC